MGPDWSLTCGLMDSHLASLMKFAIKVPANLIVKSALCVSHPEGLHSEVSPELGGVHVERGCKDFDELAEDLALRMPPAR